MIRMGKMLKLILQNTKRRSPTSTYHLLNDDEEVGIIQIRHKPSHSEEVPPEFASHVYYEIKPEYRRRGFGKEILQLGLIEAKKIGLKRVIATCHDDNLASKKIIEENGGVLKDSCVIPVDGRKFLKYEIELKYMKIQK